MKFSCINSLGSTALAALC